MDGVGRDRLMASASTIVALLPTDRHTLKAIFGNISAVLLDKFAGCSPTCEILRLLSEEDGGP
jgi:hypothetical protein